MDAWMRTVYRWDSNKGLNSEFSEGWQVRQKAPGEGRRVKRLKHYEYINQNGYRTIFPLAFQTFLPSVWQCLNPIRKKNQQHIWRHQMDFSAHTSTLWSPGGRGLNFANCILRSGLRTSYREMRPYVEGCPGYDTKLHL